MKKIICTVLLIMSMSISTYAEEKIKIAYMICVSKEDTLARFKPLTAYLENKINKKVEMVIFDAEDLDKTMKEKKPEFIHTNSLLYIIANKSFKSKLLATEEKGLGGVNTAGVIFVRKGSGIKTIKDLKGKRMVFGPMFSPAGYLSSYYTLLENGINPETDLAFYSIPWGAYKHEKVMYAVYYQAFDAGSARYGDIEDMIAKKIFDKNDFDILATGEMIPYCTFSASDWADKDLAGKVKQALLGLTSNDFIEVDKEKINVTKAADIKGYKVLKDSDYDLIRKMANKIEMISYTSE
ncbi:phosphate/phosphite/phosphonate ABC transporter substrate-binding protein [Candidatus Poribacteria bacterium]|nr:phosphate/phosphite/phosphonate ABC transporter substrate-binding protein [Candidatus Poribacteria bacterium]